jgi:hypothetical protein
MRNGPAALLQLLAPAWTCLCCSLARPLPKASHLAPWHHKSVIPMQNQTDVAVLVASTSPSRHRYSCCRCRISNHQIVLR